MISEHSAHLTPLPSWLSHLALAIWMFVVVNYDALAQASDIRIERRQVVFLCWMQDSKTKSKKSKSKKTLFNPLRAKFFRGNINIYLHFVSFLHIDTTQVIEILPQIRQGSTYSTYSISWLLMSWRRKEPGHQQPRYWPSWTEITRSPHVKG